MQPCLLIVGILKQNVYNASSSNRFLDRKCAACRFVWYFTSSGYSGFQTVSHILHSENAAWFDIFNVVCTAAAGALCLARLCSILLLFRPRRLDVRKLALRTESSSSSSESCPSLSSPLSSVVVDCSDRILSSRRRLGCGCIALPFFSGDGVSMLGTIFVREGVASASGGGTGLK